MAAWVARDGVERLIGLLMIERRGYDPVAAGSYERGARDPADAEDELPHTWLATAAALAAGEPKRALRILDGAPVPTGPTPRSPDACATLARALRAAAVAMEHHWRPGSTAAHLPPRAALDVAAAGAGLGTAVAAIRDPGLRLCAHLAGRVLPEFLSARTTLGHAASAGAALSAAARYGASGAWAEQDLGEGVQLPLEWFDVLYDDTAAAGRDTPTAYHLLLAADLRARAGDHSRADALLREAPLAAPDDRATQGFSALLAGDRELGVPGAAEQAATVRGGPQDPAAAAAHYERAEAAYRAAGARRGQAAALLRLAHTARLEGRPEDCRTALESALRLAFASVDGACAALVRVHRGLDLIEAGAETEPQDAEAVRRWGSTVGSGSWLRGLADIVMDRAASWGEQGEIVKCRRALLLADRLAAEGPATYGQDPAAAWADMYRRAHHRQAALVLTDLRMSAHAERIQGRTAEGAAPGSTDVLGVIEAAQFFHHHALGLVDPELVAASRSRLERARTLGSRLPTGPGPVEAVLDMLAADLAALPVWEALYRSRRARNAGLEADADDGAARALDEATRRGDGFGRCSALVELRRIEEAKAEARALDERGAPSDAAVDKVAALPGVGSAAGTTEGLLVRLDGATAAELLV
ncbi:hypothetical protein ACTWQE_17755, partial [Streptomyces sp. 8N706]